MRHFQPVTTAIPAPRLRLQLPVLDLKIEWVTAWPGEARFQWPAALQIMPVPEALSVLGEFGALVEPEEVSEINRAISKLREWSGYDL